MSKPNDQQPVKKTVPAAAMCFSVGAFQFAAGDEGSKKVPITLLGRTGKPIAHWYWGNVVHDLAGMKLHKDSLPIDYCHMAEEVIGYLDKFETSSGDLVAKGALTPFREDDRAAEVNFKAKQGVPYEASINFGGAPVRLEEIDAGISVVVNGNQVNGPALIIREWTLRGIAVCPYGADMNTKTELSAKGGEQLAATVEVTLFKGPSMSQTTEAPKAPETQPEPTQLAAAADPAKKPAEASPATTEAAKQLADGGKPAEGTKPEPKPGAEFVAAFGSQGAVWYLEGKSFQACAAEFIAAKDKEIAELKQANKQLTDQIGAMPRGNEAASFAAAPAGDKPPRPKGINGGAAAVFADAMNANKQA